MKHYLFGLCLVVWCLTLSTALSGCGQERSAHPEFLAGVYRTADPSPVLGSTLDLSYVIEDGREYPAVTVFSCNGSFNSFTPVGGVRAGYVRFTPDPTTTQAVGVIQFGPQPYQGASDPRCATSSGKVYTYYAQGKELTLCSFIKTAEKCTQYQR